MLDPYRMVIVNIIFSVFLISAFLFYRYIYPKKTPPYLLIIFMLSLLPLISMFRKGSYESGDLSLHAMRIFSYYKILFSEHIRPVWTPEFNAGYGDPHFLFSYFLPYFLASVIHKIGFSLIFSIKALLAITYVLSGIFVYIFVKHEISEKAGLVAAVFYLFFPYHLVDMHFRVTIAESMSFAFLPLCLYFSSQLIKTISLKYVILLSTSYSLLILTHQITSLAFAPIIVSYALIIYILKKKKSFKEIAYLISSILLGLGLSSFYWIPIIAESKFTQASLTQTIAIFPKIQDLLFSTWRYGLLFQGHFGELSFLIGYTQIVVLILSFSLLRLKNRRIKTLSSYFIFCSAVTIFLILPYSEIIWQKVPLLKYFQFSYRLLVFLSFFISFLAGGLVMRFKSNLFLSLLLLVTVFYTGLNWGNRKSIPEINDHWLQQELMRKPDVGNYLEPSSPIWASVKSKFLRQNERKHIELLAGQANISEIRRTSTRHEYLINADTNVLVKENTLFFPGWELRINGKIQNFNFSNPNFPGVINFKIEKGIHKIDLSFEDTPVVRLSKFVSVLGMLILLFILIKSSLIRIFASNYTYISRGKRNRNTP